MFAEWLGTRGEIVYSLLDKDGAEERIKLGSLYRFIYDSPPDSGYRGYRQPAADFVKPILLHVGDSYYTVYGDTQLAEHLPLPGHPDRVAAYRYAGNILYALSHELPPALQSCGVGPDGLIWIADQENRLAAFRTGTKEFVQAAADMGTSRTLVPRMNPAGSVFRSETPGGPLVEARVDWSPTPVVSKPESPRRLPAETSHVLYCDQDILVYVEGKRLREERRNPNAVRSLDIEMADDERVMEGAHSIEKGETALLIAKDIQPGTHNIVEVRKSWQTMRVVWLQFPKREEK